MQTNKLFEDIFGDLFGDIFSFDLDCNKECKCDKKCECKKEEKSEEKKSALDEFNEAINTLNDVLKSLESLKEEKTEEKKSEAREIKIENAEEKKEEKPVLPPRPSEKLSTQDSLDLHKVVGEYVDTMIKPYTDFDKNTVNDIYAGLFEFAAWMLNK